MAFQKIIYDKIKFLLYYYTNILKIPFIIQYSVLAWVSCRFKNEFEFFVI